MIGEEDMSNQLAERVETPAPRKANHWRVSIEAWTEAREMALSTARDYRRVGMIAQAEEAETRAEKYAADIAHFKQRSEEYERAS
jgi:hypothetical protein